MCGRYVSTTPPNQLALQFGAESVVEPEEFAPDFNVAPTDLVPAVLVRKDRRQVRRLRWGLVPFWAKDPAVGARMINARVETAAEKPAFRQAFAKRRCLLPADGYYEWETRQAPGQGKGASGKPPGGSAKSAARSAKSAKATAAKTFKQPFFIHSPDGETLALAGLYELWRDPGRERDDPAAWLWSATVLTTTATDKLGRIHDRCPLLVPPEARERWLTADDIDADRIGDLLVPATSGLRADPVSTEVNDVRSSGPNLIEPLAGEEGVVL
jgi:putative SOS response-associated peptidase YedK